MKTSYRAIVVVGLMAGLTFASDYSFKQKLGCAIVIGASAFIYQRVRYDMHRFIADRDDA
jgi:hypothetical protein